MDSWPTTAEELGTVYADFVTRYGKSHAVTEMARAYGIAGRTIRERLVRNGICTPRPAVRRPSDEELGETYKALRAKHADHWAIGELAKIHEVNYVTARQWLINAGLHTVTPQGARRPITSPCPCGAKAVTRYKERDPPLCFRCYMRTWSADPDSKARRSARGYVAEVKRNAVCSDCAGRFPPCVYHFDHVPERGPKLFNIGDCDRSLEVVKAEIAKCDIVCANCHAIRTWIMRAKPWIRRGDGVPAKAEAAGLLF